MNHLTLGPLQWAGLSIAASVLMHVSWNLIARQQDPDKYPLWWVLLSHLVLLAPWGVYQLINTAVWTQGFTTLIACSAVSNALYFLGLKKAYQHAPVALVYPLVRSSPLLIALWGVLIFGQDLNLWAWLGIAVSVTGLLVMAVSSKNGTQNKALPWAVLSMLCTSVYSISDKAATAQIDSVAGLLGFVSFGYLAALITLSIELRLSKGHWLPHKRPPMWVIVLGGLFVGFAYVLVIDAMRVMPAALAVAFSNSGIVLAMLLSIFLFNEKQNWKARMTGGVIIMLGLGLTLGAF